MKKLIFIFTIFLIIFTKNIFAQENFIKIGITKSQNVSKIHFDNQNISVGYGKDYNFFQKANLNSTYGFDIKFIKKDFVRLPDLFLSYEDALNKSNQIKDAFPMLENDSWKVYINGFNNIDEAKKYIIDNNIMADAIKTNYSLGIYSENNLLMGYTGDSYSLQFKNDTSRICLNGNFYRNVIQINAINDKLSAINIINVEEYLYGVIPSEMPSSWHIEALKAQAVAARNYTYSNLSLHSKEGFDLCDTIHCQVYNGASIEKDQTTRAVNETKNLIAYYNNKIINAVYSSSNGGYSENSENVWNNREEYLRAIKDENEEGAKIWEKSFTFDEITNLAGNIGNVNEIILEKDSVTNRAVSLKLIGDLGEKILKKEEIRSFFSKSSKGSLDSRMFDIKQAVSTNKNDLCNKIYAINKDNTYNLDIKKAYYVSSKGEILKNDINYILDKNSNIYLFTDIYSDKNFDSSSSINNQNNIQTIKRINTNTITFFGKGWGHGVGMSQYGANSLAKKGYKFDEILKYYYTGIEIK